MATSGLVRKMRGRITSQLGSILLLWEARCGIKGCPESVGMLCPVDSDFLAPVVCLPFADSVSLGKLLELCDFHFLSCKLGLRIPS